ncbi:hypothetical protein FQZ97_891720 [compost metagenome]
MEFSAHAVQRCHQRGIRPVQVEWLIDHGAQTWHRGARVFYFDRECFHGLLRGLLPAERQLAEKARNSYVVVIGDCIITVGHRETSFCVRKPKAHHRRRMSSCGQQRRAA